MGPKNTVIVPLYSYPATKETWQPLYAAVSANPELEFVVIVNPNSGPGDPPWWPNARYVDEVSKLNRYSNVTTLGYVRTNYCNRDVAETCRDVVAYGNWSDDRIHDDLYVRGIFFDETPNSYTGNVAAYLETVDRMVRTTVGIAGPQLVVHNPGTMPDERLLGATHPDVTVVLEESVARYRSCNAKENDDLDRFDWSRGAVILHSAQSQELRAVVQEAKQRARHIFVTDLNEGYYNRFGQGWQELVNEIGR